MHTPHQFREGLKTWLSSHESVSQRALAMAADLPPSILTGWLKHDSKNPTLDALTKLLPAIERHSTRTDALTLLVAYLRDETPPRYEPDIHITATDSSAGTPATDILRSTAVQWEHRARTDATFARMWLDLDSYMHGTTHHDPMFVVTELGGFSADEAALITQAARQEAQPTASDRSSRTTDTPESHRK